MSHLNDPKIKKKALLRRKANALIKKIQKLGIITRTWNINAKEDASPVVVTAPVKEINRLVKEMNITTRPFGKTKFNSGEFWSYISIQVL